MYIYTLNRLYIISDLFVAFYTYTLLMFLEPLENIPILNFSNSFTRLFRLFEFFSIYMVSAEDKDELCISLTKEEMLFLSRKASEADLSLNEFIETILSSYIEE